MAWDSASLESPCEGWKNEIEADLHFLHSYNKIENKYLIPRILLYTSVLVKVIVNS